MKKALITGITGQDGSYLAELLLDKGYEVHGIIRRSSVFNTDRIDHLYQDPHERNLRIFLHYGDLTDSTSLRGILEKTQPDELYNLGAQSHVKVSFEMPEYTADTVAMGALRLLEAVRDYERTHDRKIRLYQASSSEMFGAAPPRQSETTPFQPCSPYAVSKVAAFWHCVNYRDAYGMFICNGILFNHESPRRGETFVTRKITRALGRIKHGLQTTLYLGNLEAKRDWGHALDYVEAMWMMLQHDVADDYAVATGESYSVREFLEASFSYAGMNPDKHVQIDPQYFRPNEVDSLLGDPSTINEKLGWKSKIICKELVEEMVDADMELAAREKTLIDAGHDVPAASGSHRD